MWEEMSERKKRMEKDMVLVFKVELKLKDSKRHDQDRTDEISDTTHTSYPAQRK